MRTTLQVYVDLTLAMRPGEVMILSPVVVKDIGWGVLDKKSPIERLKLHVSLVRPIDGWRFVEGTKGYWSIERLQDG
jgi:hypothetical protein